MRRDTALSPSAEMAEAEGRTHEKKAERFMIELPQEFLDRMRGQLGEEYEAFLACYEEDGYAGLRVNTEKISVEAFLALTEFDLIPVPWTANGFYYRREEPVTRHPHYYAGLYYIQEPSAMLPASRLLVSPGDMVLDLCAAPGGKATELSSRLHGTGLLVANDASPSRAKALLKNLSLWGSRGCCITGELPQRLLELFGCCFDKILVDAPCSGEGMFRRDRALIDAWKERGPAEYAAVQKEILSCAAGMLKPGGMLAYSTCTFSEQEDEAVVADILERFPELELIQPELSEGFARGAAPCEKCIRIWPQRVKGEGHFLALFQKRADAGSQAPGALQVYTKRELEASRRRMPEEVRAFLEMLPGRLWENCFYQQIGEQCLLLPPYRLPEKLRYLRTGILAGTYRRGRFEPAQALAMVLDADSFPAVLNLSSADERVIRYLKGETLALSADEPQGKKGWVLVCVDGFALGWGKYANGNVKNKYYPGWRLQ